MWQVWSSGTSKQTLEKYKNLNSGLLLIRKWDFKTKLFMFNYLENLLLQNILPKMEKNIWDLYASSVIIRQHQNRHRKFWEMLVFGIRVLKSAKSTGQTVQETRNKLLWQNADFPNYRLHPLAIWRWLIQIFTIVA